MSAAFPQVDSIRQDLACPACQYNLRGLVGAVVKCPECGQACDIAKLVAKRWVGPWQTAPGVKMVQMPAVFGGIFSLPGLLSLPVLARVEGAWWSYLVALAFAFGPWGLSMASVYRVWPGGEGLKWSLLSHAVLVGYLVGLVIGFGMFVMVVAAAVEGNVIQLIYGLLGVAVLIGVIAAARYGDRLVGEACIRRYLADAAGVETPQGLAEDERVIRG